MTMTNEDIERVAKEKGLTAPRVTNDDVDALITDEQYHVFPGTTVTTCCLTLANGFTVVGHSACASPQNFDEEMGRAIARERAWDQIRRLEGYRLCSELQELTKIRGDR